MVELVILACLAIEPQTCERFHLPFRRSMTVVECIHQGPLRVMDWAGRNPTWVLRKWTCGLPEA